LQKRFWDWFDFGLISGIVRLTCDGQKYEADAVRKETMVMRKGPVFVALVMACSGLSFAAIAAGSQSAAEVTGAAMASSYGQGYTFR
jgi:hypothetical protein